MFNFNQEYFFYKNQNSTESNKFSKSIYCPHPFTNWSLNPEYRVNGIKLHTKEGFRKVEIEGSTLEHVKSNPGSSWIYCLGGSTTYCTELYKNEQSWPAKLAMKFGANNIKVVNAGVGGFGTGQSLIRFMYWGPLIRPKLTIVYQSKNDLTPFYNGIQSQKKIFPMMENIMLPFSMAIPTSKRSYFKASVRGLAAVYSKNYKPDAENLSRYDGDCLLLTKSRYEQMALIASSWGGKVLFVPELMRPSPYLAQMNVIHDEMKKVAEINNNASFFDIREVFPMSDEYFLDKMHFSEKGCELVSDIFSTQVNELI